MQLADAKAGDKAAVKARHKELLALGGPQGKGPSDARFKGWMDRLKVGAAEERVDTALRSGAVGQGTRNMGAYCRGLPVCWAPKASETLERRMQG